MSLIERIKNKRKRNQFQSKAVEQLTHEQTTAFLLMTVRCGDVYINNYNVATNNEAISNLLTFYCNQFPDCREQFLNAILDSETAQVRKL